MKKNCHFRVYNHPILKKLIMQLKIAFIIALACTLSMQAASADPGATKASFENNNNSFKKEANELKMLKAKPKSELQQKQISGTITDEDGNSLPGVTILVKGTSLGTISDSNGRYILSNVPENSTLVFSFVGMTTQEVLAGDLTKIDVVMREAAMGLDEVVVVGYGIQKRVTLTGSVATVNSDFIEGRPLTNSSQALQGLSGLYVNQPGGQPGSDDATIRIRGIGTFNDNNPLVLVDGIEFSLRDINPNDIENISVLKDAASAAIYGNRAANGVIIITTKKGKTGKMRAELNSYYGWQKATYLPDLVTNSVDWMISRNQSAINDGQPPLYSDALIDEWRNGTDPDKYPNTDWLSIVFSTTPIQDHNFRLSGGSENIKYSTSIGYLDQEGVLIGTSAKRYSLNSNIIYKYSDRLKFGVNVTGSYWYKREPHSGMSSFFANCVTRPLPIIPNILSNGNYGDKWVAVPGYNVFWHPLASAYETYLKTYTQRGLIHLNMEYTLPLDIKYKANFAVNKYDINSYNWNPEIYLYSPLAPDIPGNQNGGSPKARHVERKNNNNWSNNFFNTLGWGKTFANNHNVNLLLGFSREAFYNSSFGAYIEGFLGNELTEINAGIENKDVSGTSNESRLMSYFGRVNYDFLEKYLFEASFRYDGSSRFAKGNRWGFFPSFSAGWRVNEEAFMANVHSLDNLKLRFSWGQLGNQNIGLYTFLSNINLNQGIILNNAVASGAAITAISDPNISWETTTVTNLGLDASLWKGALQLNIDLFNKYTSDILTRINVPAQVGDLSGPLTNLYDMSNKGIEIAVGHSKMLGDFNYKIAGQIGFVKNNVEYMSGDEQYTTNRYGPLRLIKAGYPVNSWYGYQADGLFQTVEEVENHAFQHEHTAPGDIKYRDINKDGIIDVKDMIIMGRSTPKITYGFNIDFGYKSFDINAFFQGVGGIDMYPWGNWAFGNHNGAGITKDMFENSWTPEKPNAKYPRLFEPVRGTQINSQNSTFWLQDASYLRMKNLQLTYNISSKLLNKANISTLKVYLNGQNLLTIAKYKLTDPERNILQENLNEYPSTKIYSIGCNIIF